MNAVQALKFLKAYGLMSDAQKSSCITEYDDTRRFFLENPDPKCIPLFLNSFGDTKQCAFGAYQLVEDVINRFTAEEVLPHLSEALRSSRVDVRYWCAQISHFFPDAMLVEPLQNLLRDSNRDVRYFSIMALDRINDAHITNIFRDAIATETDAENQELMRTVIANRSKLSGLSQYCIVDSSHTRANLRRCGL